MPALQPYQVTVIVPGQDAIGLRRKLQRGGGRSTSTARFRDMRTIPNYAESVSYLEH